MSLAYIGRRRFRLTRVWRASTDNLPQSGAPLPSTSGRIQGQGFGLFVLPAEEVLGPLEYFGTQGLRTPGRTMRMQSATYRLGAGMLPF